MPSFIAEEVVRLDFPLSCLGKSGGLTADFLDFVGSLRTPLRTVLDEPSSCEAASPDAALRLFTSACNVRISRRSSLTMSWTGSFGGLTGMVTSST